MTLGVSVLGARAHTEPKLDPGGIDWEELAHWQGEARPAFIGKYMIGSPWRWVHGEATTLVDPEVPGANLRLVPIQAADARRQGDEALGKDFGKEDGEAIARAIQAAIDVGDLAVDGQKNAPICVYLEVDNGIGATAAYWNAWATAVFTVAVHDKQRAETTTPVKDPPTVKFPVMVQMLLPCILTRFNPDTTHAGTWTVPTQLRTILDQQAPIGPAGGRCYGFWAVTADPTPIVASPAGWPTFAPYLQPQKDGTALAVPVRIWRYATGNAKKPVHQVGRVTLDATSAASDDPGLEAMLGIQPWAAATKLKEPTRPTQMGIDRGATLQDKIDCLTERELSVHYLPEQSNSGLKGAKLEPPLQERITFAGRYYSVGPVEDANHHDKQAPERSKDLSLKEVWELSGSQVSIASMFEAAAAKYAIPEYLAKSTSGQADGAAACWFAFNVVKQPPHTPIYFCVDCDLNPEGHSIYNKAVTALTPKQLIAYFKGVAGAVEAFDVPYAVGVYACSRALEVLYPLGLASHFWQAFPPGWGDTDLKEKRTNGTAWRHANVWQVGMDRYPATQNSSGLASCRSEFVWELEYNNAPPPTELQLAVGPRVTTLTFPPTSKEMEDASGASVAIRHPAPGWNMYVLTFTKKPSGVGVKWFGHNDPDFRGSMNEKGLADLDVAWGDPGGWSARRP